MIAVARERDLQLRVLGVSALTSLTIFRIKRPIVREGGLGPVYECLMGDRSDAANVDASVADMTIGTYEGLDLDLLAQCAGLLGISWKIRTTSSRWCETVPSRLSWLSGPPRGHPDGRRSSPL